MMTIHDTIRQLVKIYAEDNGIYITNIFVDWKAEQMEDISQKPRLVPCSIEMRSRTELV